jgi:hypothetical protein
MADARQFSLRPDRAGALWDLLLYVPTVVALAFWAAATWFNGDHALAYLLAFLASFFFLAGANRILKTRLMLLPVAPVRIDVDAETVSVLQRDGTAVDLVKDQRVFGDLAGRSFGLTGLNRTGKRLQFVFHRGQFADDAVFGAVRAALDRLAGSVRSGQANKPGKQKSANRT